MSQKLEQLRSALIGIQAHAAGLHANADMALRLLGEMQAGVGQVRTRPPGDTYGGRPAMHYGEDPAGEVERRFEELEISESPGGGEIPPQE